MPLLAWPAALLIGLSLGMLGSGGSILTVPLLHGAAGLSVPDATVTSLPVVGIVATAGLLLHLARGRVRWRETLPFAVPSVAAAFAARRWLAPEIPLTAQVVAFAALMFVAAYRMIFAGPPRARPNAPRPRAAAAGLGLVVGAITGLLGIGGGFLIVPALVLLLALPVVEAVGTSLAVIALNCAAGLLGHFASGGEAAGRVLLGPAALFSAAGVAGALVGARLAHRLSPPALRRAFAVLVTGMAFWLLGSHFA
jgi:hypothetical protein